MKNTSADNSNMGELLKKAIANPGILAVVLADMIKDGAFKDFVDDLAFLSQNTDAFNKYLSMITQLIDAHPDDAKKMTLGTFLEIHPLETIPATVDENQLSFFGENEPTTVTPVADVHFSLLSTSLTNLVKQYLNNPTRIESTRKGRITISEHYMTKDTVITYKGEDSQYTLSVERVRELFAKRVQNGAKIFNFLLQKLNEQNLSENTEFLLEELIEAGIYASPDTAYRGLKTVLDKLMRIHVEGTVTFYEGRKRKEIMNTKAAIVAARTVTYKKCVAVLPQIIRSSAPFITILPRWGYALQSENAYMLLDYIYYLARQNTEKIRERHYFTISLEAIRQHLGVPSPEEVKTMFKSEYSKLIIKPIEDAITAIEDKQQGNELKITPIYNPDYKSIHEYLKGYLKIRMSGTAFAYMKQRAIAEGKQRATALRSEGKKVTRSSIKKERNG